MLLMAVFTLYGSRKVSGNTGVLLLEDTNLSHIECVDDEGITFLKKVSDRVNEDQGYFEVL